MKNCFCKIGLLVVVSIFSWNVYAQNDSLKIDSLKKVLLTEKEDTNKVNTLNALITYYGYASNHAEASKAFNTAFAIGEKLRDTLGIANSFNEIGINYLQQSDYPEALNYLYKALELYEQLKRKPDIRYCLSLIGSTNIQQANYADALKNYKAALKIDEEMADKQNIQFSFKSIGRVYLLLADTAEALKNYNAALKISQSIGIKWEICQSYINIGGIYLNEKNYREALRSDSMALKISLEINDKNLFWTVAMCNGSLGEVYEKQGDFNNSVGNKVLAQHMYSQTLKSYLTALNIWQKEGGSKYNIASVGEGVGEIYIKQKQFTKARFYLEGALGVFIAENSKSDIKDVYQTLSTLDSTEGNYKKGYEDYKMYILYRDSIYNEDNTKKALQSNMQYDFDKKESIAKAAQDKKDADAKRIKNQQYFTIAALGIVVLAVVIIALIQFRNNKQKQKANNLITKQKQQVETTLTELKSTQAQLIQSEKMASLGELTAGIAHEIQNPLNFVNNFSEVNKELIEELRIKNEKLKIEDDEINDLLNDLADNSEKITHHGKRADAIVRGMLQHSRQTQGVREPTDINALCDEHLRLSYHGLRAKDKDFNATFTTDFDESISNINIISQDVSRVLLNLYNNAFYAVNEKQKTYKVSKDLIGLEAYKPTVAVSTRKTGNSVTVTVSDNGHGIPQSIVNKIFQPFFTTKPTGQGTGLGLSLSYDIIKAHGAEIKVESKEGKGSEFIITFFI